jgi:SpoVK/Ycf46/Vps4 family AAA+-type ATPase
MTGEPFFQFLYSIQQECIIFIDEYEKIYDNKEQEEMLTVLDGVFQSKKMFIITCNDRYKLDSHLRNRPGRVHYLIEFDGLAPAFIKEFCQENLKDKNRVNEVVQICGLFSTINFDMLQALVWEMNLYNEAASDAIKLLNAKPESDDYSIYDITASILGRDKPLESCSPNVARGSPLKEQSKIVTVTVKKEEFSPEVWTTLATSGKLTDEFGDVLTTEEIRTGKYGKNNNNGEAGGILTPSI